jgi:hypothetical protein
LQSVERSRPLIIFIVPINVGGGAQISLIGTIRYLFEFDEWVADAGPIDAINSGAIKALTPTAPARVLRTATGRP